jgi:DNA invertase Pin-like site-specific DNA recombinase
MKTEAVGYCRVSGKGQQSNGTGLDRQEDTVRAFAKQNGYKLIEIYSEAFTGTESDRPVFEKMLIDLLDNGCRIIIVECLDRLARDLAVQLQIISLLASKGITLINAMTGQDVTSPTDPMSRAMIQVQGAFAELDKNLLVRKLRKGREKKKAETGRCEGRKPFGLKPGEQDTIDRIKQLYRKKPGEERMTGHRIAKILNKENRPTQSGCQWRGGHVRAILERLGILK